MAEGVHADTVLEGLGPWADGVAGLRPATAAEYGVARACGHAFR